MKLYLVQHAQAKSEHQDPARPLTQQGIRDAESIADFLIGKISPTKILHSGKLRSSQTAQILARKLNPVEGVQQADQLDPLADPEIWARRLNQIQGDLMLVGHLPHLSKLASILLTGNKDLEPIEFQMGGVVCLERDSSGKWKLLWSLIPSLLR